MPGTDTDFAGGVSGVLARVAEHARDDVAAAARIIVSALASESMPSAPFATVLLRTQGRRMETLRDALCCLAGQTVETFETVLLCHDVTDDQFVEIAAILESQVLSFGARVRIERIEGGGRAAPLNRGIAVARGRYISVLDDDDYVFANWIESFEAAALAAPGRLVRSLVATQTATGETWPQGQQGHRHTGWPKADYPSSFALVEHLSVNASPFMGWAFPRQLFEVLGQRFDEELAVVEDWDMIVRGAMLLGVVEASELTAVYRLWDQGESSYTQHDELVWRVSEARVVEGLSSSSVVLPGRDVLLVREILAERGEWEPIVVAHRTLLASRPWRWSRPLRGLIRLASASRQVVVAALRRFRGSHR